MKPSSQKKGKKTFRIAAGILLLAAFFFIFLFMSREQPGKFWVEKPLIYRDSTLGDGQTSQPSPSLTGSIKERGQPTSTPLPTATPAPKAIWIDPALPAGLKNRIQIPQDFSILDRREGASVILTLGDQSIVGYWSYALVCPFPSVWEGVQSLDLKLYWEGDQERMEGTTQPLTVDEETKNVFTAWWGPPDEKAIAVLPQGEILDALWPDPNKWAIIPFQKLDPRWKVLAVQDQKPIHKDYEPSNAILSVPVSLSGSPVYTHEIIAENSSFSNRNPDKMTTVLLTGVTALVRDTAALMEKNGITYPAEHIAGMLSGADVTHISNEVPFASNCPTPNPNQLDLYFCSDDRYLELFQFIGTDIVELSGDHFGDWGVEAMLYTLQLYKEQGWPTYGGGKSLEEGLQPINLEHNGNRFAFISCNAKSAPKYAAASETEPGAARCDFPWMMQEIQRLKELGYIVIATLQHEEVYQYPAVHIQKQDFRALAEAGADIVSGSQAHQPQALEFHENSFIHYGLGNLFFDQHYLSQRVELYQHADESFIDMHVFYGNRHISTELFTIQFIDNAQSRLMTDQERIRLLSSVFSASEW